MGTLQYDSRSSEYGSLSRQLYATDVSTGKTVALACTPPGTGADGASCPIFQANRGPKYWANWKFDSFRLLKGTDCFGGPELEDLWTLAVIPAL